MVVQIDAANATFAVVAACLEDCQSGTQPSGCLLFEAKSLGKCIYHVVVQHVASNAPTDSLLCCLCMLLTRIVVVSNVRHPNGPFFTLSHSTYSTSD